MRLGLGRRQKDARKDERAARELWDALRQQLAGLDLGQQMEIGGALAEGRAWPDLDDWIRALFVEARRRLRG